MSREAFQTEERTAIEQGSTPWRRRRARACCFYSFAGGEDEDKVVEGPVYPYGLKIAVTWTHYDTMGDKDVDG